uniref:Uncharacterized protein n=1 Tax=Macaca nemestrina TaxID=9545 RepID=A0A2K6AN45_MACNE
MAPSKRQFPRSRRPPAIRLLPRQTPPLPQTTGAIQMPQAGPQLTKPTGRSSPQAREPLLRGQTSERRPAPSTQAWKARRQPRSDSRHLPRAAPSAVYFRTSPAIVPIGRCRAVESCLQTAPAPRGSGRPRPAWAPEALRGGGGRGLGATLSISQEPVALCFGAVESPTPPPPRGESKNLYGSEKVALSPFSFPVAQAGVPVCLLGSPGGVTMEGVAWDLHSFPLVPHWSLGNHSPVSPLWSCVPVREEALCGGQGELGQAESVSPAGLGVGRLRRRRRFRREAWESGAFRGGGEEYCHFEPLCGRCS